MLPAPCPDLRKYVDEQASKHASVSERRESVRYVAVLEVVVVPLDETYKSIGKPFLALTRDVSTSGMCLLHTRPAPTPLLFVEIARPPEPPLKVVLQVCRNRRIGQFFEIAGNFVEVDGKSPSNG
jgi:hypothetical protein